MAKEKENKLSSFFVKHKIIGGLLLSVFFIVLLGTPTALIPNPLIHYVRMTPITWLDYFFLFTTGILVSANIIIFLEKKAKKEGAIFGGGFLGFLAFACPICNIILVSLLGSAFILTFIEPLRPIFGVASIIILVATLHFQMKISSCDICDENENQIG